MVLSGQFKNKLLTFKITIEMEANNNMTAERSLEIITTQIAQSRKDVSKDVGLSLYIAGFCTMGTALVIGICTFFTYNSAFYLLYFALPLIIYGFTRYAKRNQPPTPSSLFGTMVAKTWLTFAIFALSFFVFVNLFDFLVARTEAPDVAVRLMIHPFRTILLLMGMCVTITGYILKSRWLVWCGIIGGIGGFIWETFNVTGTLFAYIAADISNYCGVVQGLIPGIIVALFAFIGLTLPGLMLKRQK